MLPAFLNLFSLQNLIFQGGSKVTTGDWSSWPISDPILNYGGMGGCFPVSINLKTDMLIFIVFFHQMYYCPEA